MDVLEHERDRPFQAERVDQGHEPRLHVLDERRFVRSVGLESQEQAEPIGGPPRNQRIGPRPDELFDPLPGRCAVFFAFGHARELRDHSGDRGERCARGREVAPSEEHRAFVGESSRELLHDA